MISPRRAFGQRGMSLIEVLVTLVLLSVGLLGVAALQLTSLRSNKEAAVRTKASMLASAMIDRIRANQPGFRQDFYKADYNEAGAAGTPAGEDLKAWQADIDRLLPGGAASAAGKIDRTEVVTAAGSAQVVTITIRWNERVDNERFAANGGVSTEDLTFQLRSEI